MVVKYIQIITCICSILILASAQLVAQEKVIEITGQVFFANSDEPVSSVDITVEGTSRRTQTNESGNFSIVVNPKETLIFSGSGLLDSKYTVPESIQSTYHNIKQYIQIDTTQYKEVVITKYLSKEEFDFLMKYGYIPDANLVASRKNVNQKNLQSFIDRAPRAYYESQMMLQQSIYNNHGSMYGQQKMQGGINPFAWYDFFKNWKKNTKNSEK